MTSRDNTHYQTLGTSRFASAAEVRAAYLRLMKLHHPDVSQAPRFGPSPEQINAAYSVLRSPSRRAVYDAQISGLDAQRKVMRAAMPPPGVAVRRINQPPPLYKRLRAALLTLAMGTAAAWFTMATPSTKATAFTTPGSGGGIPAEKAEDQAPTTPPQVRSRDVVDAVGDFQWIMVESRSEEVATYSAHCFSQLAQEPDLRLLDRCVAFDLAASYLLPAHRAGASHFAQSSTIARHARAARFLPAETATARLRQLDRMTVNLISLPERRNLAHS